MIVLDASVLIAFLDADDSHHQAAETLLAREIDELAANPLTVAEVLVVPAREDRLGPVMKALRDLEVQELPFPADTATRLAALRADTGLKMPDCCVLLSADEAQARLATFDARVADAAENRELEVLRR